MAELNDNIDSIIEGTIQAYGLSSHAGVDMKYVLLDMVQQILEMVGRAIVEELRG
jgi:hypothetical protein